MREQEEVVKPIAYRRPEAARAIGMSLDTIDKLIADGSLKSLKVRGSRLIPVVELEAFIARKLQEQNP